MAPVVAGSPLRLPPAIGLTEHGIQITTAPLHCEGAVAAAAGDHAAVNLPAVNRGPAILSGGDSDLVRRVSRRAGNVASTASTGGDGRAGVSAESISCPRSPVKRARYLNNP